MQNRTQHDIQTASAAGEYELVAEGELDILRDVFRMLPSGVTVQDEQGHFLLMNDAATAQFKMTAAEPAAAPSKELIHRRETAIGLLRAGHPTVTEECMEIGPAKQVFLTAHRPVR